MNTIGLDQVGSLLRLLITRLPNLQLRLMMHLRGGTDRTYMNSNSAMALAWEWRMPSRMRMTLLSTSASLSSLVSGLVSSSSMSSTSVTTGATYARSARPRSIHLKLSALFPTGPCRTSDGVQFPTNTAAYGVLTMARLSQGQTLSLLTSRRFDSAGDLVDEIAVESSLPRTVRPDPPVARVGFEGRCNIANLGLREHSGRSSVRGVSFHPSVTRWGERTWQTRSRLT